MIHCVKYFLCPFSDGLYQEQKEMMLRCVRTCMELDSPSFKKPTFVLTENSSSLVSLNLRKAQEALIELLGDENMFQQNVQLPYKYHIGMKSNYCHILFNVDL